MELLKLQDAARLLNVSYPTIKQWIYQEKIKSVKTPGGHHRIPRSEVERLIGKEVTGIKEPLAVTERSVGRGVQRQKKAAGIEAISGRNKLLGVVTDVQYDGLLAQVTIDIGGQLITSLITRGACEDLGLTVGMQAYALIKATEVMVIRK